MCTLLQQVLESLREQDHRRADLWICSDRQSLDWDPDSASWQSVDQLASQLGDGCRYFLMDFPADQRTNRAVQITEAQWRQNGAESGLALSVRVTSASKQPATLPVAVRSGGITQTVNVEVVDGIGERSDIVVKVGERSDQVFGEVSIPADANAADDRWYFASRANSSRPIALISQDSSIALQVASEVIGRRLDFQTSDQGGPDAEERGRVVPDREQWFSQAAMVVWQGDLPRGADAAELDRFVRSGGSVVFFPPSQTPSESSFLGVRWGQWVDRGAYTATLDEWEFSIQRYCPINGDLVGIATVADSAPLIGSMRHDNGTVIFCGGDVVDANSMFVSDGLALYAMLSDGLARSSRMETEETGRTARRRRSGEPMFGAISDAVTRLQPAESETGAVVEFGSHAGVFSVSDTSDVDAPLMVINRDAGESTSLALNGDQLQQIVPSIDWDQVSVRSQSSESPTGFVREVWVAVWSLMILAMLAEALLSLPRRVSGVSR